MKSFDLTEKLKDAVRRKFGRDIKYTKDCRNLADQIFELTNRRLSISTVKRFFGMVHSSFQPSKFTLETLAAFMGFENLQAYISYHKETHEPGSGTNLQEMLKLNAQIITEKSLESLIQKTGYSSEKFIQRNFAQKHLDAFIKSGKAATMLVAPSGYGKSSTLLQWFGDCISETGSKFENDIVCIIDGGIFFTFYNLTHNVKIVNQLIDFDENMNPGFFVNPDEQDRKWRYIVVIDDVDEIFSRKEKYYHLAENIMRIVMMNNENRHFYLILTCRPENIDPFTSLIKYNPSMANSWFNSDFNFQNHSEFINVPLMSQTELHTALTRSGCNVSFHFFTFCQHELLRVINLPSYFSYFIYENDKSPVSFSEKIVLNNLVQHIIYSSPFAEEKQLLVKTFFRLCDAEENADYVNKEKLLEETECHLAYRELLKSGLIYETIVADVFKVRFSNKVIYEFLLFKYLLQGRELNIELFEELFQKFKNKHPIQYAVIKWFVKFTFSENNTDLLQQMYHFMEQEKMQHDTSKPILSGFCHIFQITFSECLRLHRESCKILLPWLAESPLGRKLYFEDCFDIDNLMFFPAQSLDVFENHSRTADGLIFVHFIRFIKGFYTLEFKKCTLEYERIKKMSVSELQNPLSAAYYFTSQILHSSSFCKKEKDPDILRKIMNSAAELRKTGDQAAPPTPRFEFFIIYNLNTCNLFEEIISFSEYIEEQNDFSGSESDCFYQHYKLCQARALLHLKQESEALKIYREYKSGVFPPYVQHFMKMNAGMIRADFLLHQHKKAEALELLKEIKSLAGFLEFRFFVQQATEMELKIKKSKKNSFF